MIVEYDRIMLGHGTERGFNWVWDASSINYVYLLRDKIEFISGVMLMFSLRNMDLKGFILV
jgi:hypothetical protein